jgi:hypothetical protein
MGDFGDASFHLDPPGSDSSMPPFVPGAAGTGSSEPNFSTFEGIDSRPPGSRDVTRPEITRPDFTRPDLMRPDFAQHGESTSPPLSSSADLGALAYHNAPEHDSDTGPIHSTPPPMPGFSGHDMESMIQRTVQEALEKMAQKILPEVAERVIKQEINRLLNEKV